MLMNSTHTHKGGKGYERQWPLDIQWPAGYVSNKIPSTACVQKKNGEKIKKKNEEECCRKKWRNMLLNWELYLVENSIQL